jgi:muconolactone delta-isomerase
MSIATTMATATPDHLAPQAARRAKSTRATSRRADQGASKPRKVSFYLSPEAIRRLGVAASMLDTDKSKVLEQVLATSPTLKRFVVSDRSRGGDHVGEDRQEFPVE